MEFDSIESYIKHEFEKRGMEISNEAVDKSMEMVEQYIIKLVKDSTFYGCRTIRKTDIEVTLEMRELTTLRG